MTRKQNNLSKRTGWIITLISVFVLSCSLLFSFACGGTDKTSKRDKYNVTTAEEDDLAIANGTFEFGTADVKNSDYPYATSISWTKTNTNATSSTRNSGIISTAEEDYDVLLEKLYSADVNDSDYPADSTLSKAEWRLEQLRGKHPNPGVHDGAKETDKKILMIYNFNATEKKGTAQKFTSSSSVELKANTYGKISVWVKTVDLKSRSDGADFGANINVTNTLNGVTQDQLRIKNINTNGEWTNYVIHVKGSDSLPVTLKVVLGLGYPNGGSAYEQEYVEGQAFFDDVTYEEITEEDYNGAVVTETKKSSYLATASDKTIDLDQTAKSVKFDFDVATHTAIDLSDYDVSEIADPSLPANSPLASSTGYTVNLDGTAKTVNLLTKKVPANGFYYVSFYVKTKLNLTATGVNVFVEDRGTDGCEEKDFINNKSFTNIRTEKTDDELYGDWVKYSVLIKNNYKEAGADDRSFMLKAIIGSTDPDNISDKLANPTGTVYISHFEEVTGSIKDADDNNTEAYAMVASFTGDTNASVSLIAPKSSDYKDPSDDDTTYSFNPVYTEADDIKTGAVKARGLYSMIPDGNGDYLYGASDAKVTNGVINTKYLAGYADANLAPLFAGRDADTEYQPIMINNKEATNFGYYFSSSSTKVEASSFVKVSVQVKVSGDAKAYIYIVKTDKASGETVLNAKDFKANLDAKLQQDVVMTVTDTSSEDGDFKTVDIYLSAGKAGYDFRVELWNGSRDGSVKSTGYVFFNSVTVTSSSLSDITAITDEFEANNAIDISNPSSYPDNYARYTQELNKYEIDYNKTAKTDDKISYDPSVVYLNDGDTLIARYDTIAPVENDPSAKDDSDDGSDDDTTTDGDKKKVDSATFWLSFSSILLAVLIVVVIVYILVKKIVKKKKAKKSGAVQSYNIHSRAHALKEAKAKNDKPVVTDDKDADDNETPVEEEPETEEYTYGDVQNFDDDAKETEEEIAEVTGETNNADETIVTDDGDKTNE